MPTPFYIKYPKPFSASWLGQSLLDLFFHILIIFMLGVYPAVMLIMWEKGWI